VSLLFRCRGANVRREALSRPSPMNTAKRAGPESTKSNRYLVRGGDPGGCASAAYHNLHEDNSRPSATTAAGGAGWTARRGIVISGP